MSRVLFNGKLLREPGAATQLRVGVQPAVNPNATNRVAVIGEADGGLTQSCYTFNNYFEALDVLRGGDSLKAIASIFNPSPLFGGAAQVDFIRAQAATTASKTFADATAKVAFTVTSKDRGTWTNGITLSLSAGASKAGTGTVTVAASSLTFSVSQDGVLNVGDTVTVGVNTHTITGRTSGTLWVITGGVVATSQPFTYVNPLNRVVTVKVPSRPIQSGTDGVAVLATKTFESASAKWISRGARIGDSIVVRNAGATTVVIYTIASIVSESQVTLVESPTAGSSLIFDHVTYERTVVSGELAPSSDTTKVSNNLVNWINTNLGDVLVAATGVADSVTAAIATATPLTGGTVTAMTTGDITTALQGMRTKQVNHLYVARACGSGAGELNFAGLVRGHLVNDAETPAIGFLGAAADKTVDDAITYAGTLNSGRLVYCFQTALDAAMDGLSTEEIPGYMVAAKAAGLAAGVTPEVPLTRKPLAVLGLKDLPGGVLLDKPTRERLLAAGVFHIYRPAGSNTFVVNQGVTTLQSTDNLWDTASASSPEISLMRIADTILDDLKRSAAATFVGATASFAKPVIEHFVTSYLQSQTGTLLTSFENLVVTQSQDKWYVSFGMVPNYPCNYVLITGTILA